MSFELQKADQKLREHLTQHLRHARSLTDGLFRLVRREAMYERPIAERHRIIFYLGHLEAFDWNMIGRRTLGLEPFHASFDQLFEFGIDPIDGALPQEAAEDWPSLGEVYLYTDNVRQKVDEFLAVAPLGSSAETLLQNGLIFWVAIEHRLMHAETLAYIFHWLPYEKKRRSFPVMQESGRTTGAGQVAIPRGPATLGLKTDERTPFGWDNEFDQHVVDVPAFSIDVHNVTNAQFLEFVRDGGYQDGSLWTEAAWNWITSSATTHPKFWVLRGDQWHYRTMFAEIPLPLDWPVYVSQAEASAYSRRRGMSLPTEAQYHRAAFGTDEDYERLYPWGEAAPDSTYGNFDFALWNPSPIGNHPRGISAFGVEDLMGNGWEWTSTIFEPFAGFKPFPFYPGYSADFFDGKHYVMKGASPRTSSLLMRRTFRNWFQPHYPNTYTSFRCVET